MPIALEKETEEWAKKVKEQFIKNGEMGIPNTGDVLVYEEEFRDHVIDPLSDKINHPKHYGGDWHVLEFIEKNDLGFAAGNVIKYVSRYKRKNGIADLKKARNYLNKLIDNLE